MVNVLFINIRSICGIGLTRPQQRTRLTNPTANVNFSKKKTRLLNKRKGTAANVNEDVDMDAMEDDGMS